MAKDENKDKLKSLQMTMERLDKAYGKGTVMRLGDNAIQEIEVIPTGSLTLDIALGIKGLPKGRIIEVYGQNLQVKQLWLFMLLQKHRKKVVFVQ